ncbi:MAG TPA: hypothetical protein VIG24_09170 [Acidimicrobiia bacterium]
MTLLFTDSFDGVLLGSKKWDQFNDNYPIDAASGKNGNGLHIDASLGSTEMYQAISPATNRVYAGAWVERTGTATDDGDRLLQLRAGSDEFFIRHGDVTTSTLLVGGTGITSQSIGDRAGQRFQWTFLEIMWEPGVAAEVRANGVSIFSATPGGSGTPDLFRMRRPTGSSGPNRRVDDVYVLDSSGSVANGFLGPVAISNMIPDGSGNRSELVGSDGNSVDNYLLVNDGDDGTYVEGDALDGDLYTFGDLAGSEDVLGAVQTWRAFDSAGGAITGRAIARVNATEYDGDDHVLGGSVATRIQEWTVNPDTGLAWTPAEINGVEFGVEFA